ncbi:reverse transcriptase domain-containing protein [Tanacetum coccineum]
MEAKPLATITGKQVVNFTYDNIVCSFGIPATIITDNGTQFVNDPFKKWAEKLTIQLISTSVYHPYGNRVVERANKSLLRGIKTSLTYGTEAVIPTDIGKLGSTWEGPYKVIQAFQSGAYKLSNIEGEEIPRT